MMRNLQINIPNESISQPSQRVFIKPAKVAKADYRLRTFILHKQQTNKPNRNNGKLVQTTTRQMLYIYTMSI